MLLLICTELYSADGSIISVFGDVTVPLNLRNDDLSRFRQCSVYGIIKKGRGMKKQYNGIPLKNLLEFSGVMSQRSEFTGSDYLFIIKSRSGSLYVFSWTDIFCADKTDALIVTAEDSSINPALVYRNSTGLLCALPAIKSIEVRMLNSEPVNKNEISDNLRIRDKNGKFHYINKLKLFARTNNSMQKRKTDREGIPLDLLLRKNNITVTESDAVIMKFTDGRIRAVSHTGLNKCTVENNLNEIDIIKTRGDAKLYIIGIGCADSSLVTLDAISCMGKCDVFICSDDIKKRFSRYMAGKPVLFDPFINIEGYQKKMNPELSFKECKEKVAVLRKQNIAVIKGILASGKSIGFLEYGDPALYPHWTSWLWGHVPEKSIVMRPGLSALNASNAMIGGNVAGKGSLIATVPGALLENESLLKAAASNGDTLAIFTGLRDLKMLKKLFLKYYHKDSPVLLVYRAGYSQKEKIVRTTVSEAPCAAMKEKEKWLGMIYIGGAVKVRK